MKKHASVCTFCHCSLKGSFMQSLHSTADLEALAWMRCEDWLNDRTSRAYGMPRASVTSSGKLARKVGDQSRSAGRHEPAGLATQRSFLNTPKGEALLPKAKTLYTPCVWKVMAPLEGTARTVPPENPLTNG